MKKTYLKSILILIFTASALSAQTNIKWQQTFATTTIPDGWRTIDADGNGSGLELVSTAKTPEDITIPPQAGGAFWTSNAQNSNLAGVLDEWLISPGISLIYAGDSLFFYAGANDQGFDDSIRVKISTTDNKRESFIHQLANIKIDGPPGQWNLYGFDLSAFDSSKIYVAINYYIKDGGPGGQNSDFVWIDHPFITGDTPTAIEDNIAFNPVDLVLYQNYPNPFNPETTIKYQLSKPGTVNLTVHNLLGQQVATLVSEEQASGIYQVKWNASGFSSGVYVYRLQSSQGVKTKKLILMK